MKLLVESQDFNEFSVLEESAGKGLYIEGPFIQMDVVNGNKRVYPSDVIAPCVEAYITEYVNTNRAVGELNHPASPMIDYDRACIKIDSLVREGSNYIGKAKVMESLPKGAIVGGLLREGVKIGVSSRALGSVALREDGVKVVQADYCLRTAADVVSDPSAPDAFVTALMENKEWVYQNGILQEKESEIKHFVNSTAKGGLTAEKLLDIFVKVSNLATHK